MPKRDDIHKVLIIGSGPIVIGQACEFDYSGTQAFGLAFHKAETAAAAQPLPESGTVPITVADRDKQAVFQVARRFREHRLQLQAPRAFQSFIFAGGRRRQRSGAPLHHLLGAARFTAASGSTIYPGP